MTGGLKCLKSEQGWLVGQKNRSCTSLRCTLSVLPYKCLECSSKKAYSEAVSSLKKQFKPVDIEELKGIEFHQKMQTSESIEKLGITLQTLGKKAFPGIGEKEFNRLLKGRFFRALHTRWQWKLGAPKPTCMTELEHWKEMRNSS